MDAGVDACAVNHRVGDMMGKVRLAGGKCCRLGGGVGSASWGRHFLVDNWMVNNGRLVVDRSRKMVDIVNLDLGNTNMSNS